MVRRGSGLVCPCVVCCAVNISIKMLVGVNTVVGSMSCRTEVGSVLAYRHIVSMSYKSCIMGDVCKM